MWQLGFSFIGTIWHIVGQILRVGGTMTLPFLKNLPLEHLLPSTQGGMVILQLGSLTSD
jgi:hypothetical protein